MIIVCKNRKIKKLSSCQKRDFSKSITFAYDNVGVCVPVNSIVFENGKYQSKVEGAATVRCSEEDKGIVREEDTFWVGSTHIPLSRGCVTYERDDGYKYLFYTNVGWPSER